jgi:endonuclease-3
MMLSFRKLIERLQKKYGEPSLPPARGPLELVLWENACYLLPDERRREVFEGLREQVGLTAKKIAAATDEVLLPLAKRGGMRPETRVFRWREIARIAQTQFGGDLNAILKEPHAKARRALKQFPNIGEPGAEKILMLCGMAEGLPLESNGLRVLVRVGYGREQKNYGATYKSVQANLKQETPTDAEALTKSHMLLRTHGKELCKDKAPLCAQCPVAKYCDYAQKMAASFIG